VIEAVADVAAGDPGGPGVAGFGQAGQRVADTQPMPVGEAPRQQQRIDESVEFGKERPFGDAVGQARYREFPHPAVGLGYLDPDHRMRLERAVG
jgi:hypothetical protein